MRPREVDMAWVKPRITGDGEKRYVACYRDPEGRTRSAGTYPSHRAAERAGNREEQRVLAGDWHDHTLGAIPFRQYVENDWLPRLAVTGGTDRYSLARGTATATILHNGATGFVVRLLN
jgi:hypothetical protein